MGCIAGVARHMSCSMHSASIPALNLNHKARRVAGSKFAADHLLVCCLVTPFPIQMSRYDGAPVSDLALITQAQVQLQGKSSQI